MQPAGGWVAWQVPVGGRVNSRPVRPQWEALPQAMTESWGKLRIEIVGDGIVVSLRRATVLEAECSVRSLRLPPRIPASTWHALATCVVETVANFLLPYLALT